MNLIVNFLIVLAVLLGLFFLVKLLSPYFVRITTVFYVSGSMGTGKDVLSHKYALARYRVARREYVMRKKVHNFKQKFLKPSLRVPYGEDAPLFLSTVPVLIKYHKKLEKQIISSKLTLDTILLKERMPRGSVVYISDINRMINQYAYKNINVVKHVSEYITMFRQYTKGGYIIVNSQASFQVAKEIRGLFGKIRNNLSFKKFLCFYRIEGRTITLSEDVINVEQGDADSKDVNTSYIYGFLNPFIRRYDTYAYYGRVYNLPVHEGQMFKKANTNYFLDIPEKLTATWVDNIDNDYKVNFELDFRQMVKYAFIFSLVGLVGVALFKNLFLMGVMAFLYVLMYYDAKM